MNRFWSQGYELTSVRGLADQMGITGASLYNAFGSKRSLYQRSLDHYLDVSVHDRIARLERLTPLSAIRAFFYELVERSVGGGAGRGCLLINSAMELAPHDPEFRAVVVEAFARLEAFFHRQITAGQRDGTITDTRPPEELARTLLAVLLGLRVMARTCPTREMLYDMVGGALGLLVPATL